MLVEIGILIQIGISLFRIADFISQVVLFLTPRLLMDIFLISY